MAADNNGFNLLEELTRQQYYSSSCYPYDYYTRQQQMYPYVQPHQLLLQQQQQQQQQLLWNSYLQQQQQQQQREQLLQLEKQQAEEERVKREELEREMAERRLNSFLETDNSFLMPWNWTPEDAPPVDNHASSTSRPMKIEYGGSFFSDNLVFSSEDKITEYLSATYGKLDSSDKKDVEQVSTTLLDQDLPRTNVGTEHEKSEDLSGTNAKLVSENSTDQNSNNSSVQNPIGIKVEQVSGEFNVDQIADQYTLKHNRSKKFGQNAKWKKGASKVQV